MSLPEATTAEYTDFFKGVSVKTLPKPPLGKVVCVKDTESVREAARLLAAHNILSAPCIDTSAPEDANWMEKYCGTVDAVNLAFWMLQKTEGVYEHLDDLLRHELASTPISEVLAADPATYRFAPFTPLDEERNTLLDCMVLMGKYALHRCYVVEPNAHDITNVITQSMLVDFLHSNMDKFPKLADRTVKQLNIGTRSQMATVTKEQTFMDAFRVMQQQCVSAVPVLDGQDCVVGVVSARDARLLITRPTRLRFVHKPLSFFQELEVEPFRHQTITVQDTTTLRQVVAALAQSKVHRVFIVDVNRHLLGVISLRDVIAAFVVEPKESKLSDYFAA